LSPVAAAAVIGTGEATLRAVVERDRKNGTTNGPPVKSRPPPWGWAVRSDQLLAWMALAAETGRLGPPRPE
jgi:hypothetical protein